MDAQEALKLYTKAKDYWSEIYQQWVDDVRFSIGLDHHYGKDEDTCLREGLLTVPVLPQFIHQVVNDMRMNTPSINVLPSEDEQSDIDTAKILKGWIRNIEYKSKADAVYDTASEYAVRGGFGFARIDHDYIDDYSDKQELLMKRVQNPMSVYLDPSYIECDGSDAEYGFILQPITKEEFEKKFPGKTYSSFDDKQLNEGNDQREVNICEFFTKEYSEQTNEYGRKIRKVTVKRYLFSGVDTLEETTFPGKYIPIVPFLGEEVWVDGKRYLLSLIRNAKDAQRRLNKWATKESQILDMSPIAPIMAPLGSVEDFGPEYAKIGDVTVIRYRQYDAAGQPLNKPERLAAPQIPTGFVNAMQEAGEQVKQAMGMYNASIGARSNETSGVAIDARKVEGEVATFHFADNRNRSIQHLGRILVCAAPEVLDTARIIQIIGDEDEPKLVGINGMGMQEGQDKPYDLRKGKYDVRVTTGASYTTKRQEAAALLSDLITKTPQLMGVMGDLLFKNMDIAGADAIAARVKKTIPKELLADEEAQMKGEQPIDPEKEEMAQIIEALSGQLQQVEAALQSKQGEEAAKMAELKIKQEELAIKQQEVGIKEADMKLKYLQALQQTEPQVEVTKEMPQGEIQAIVSPDDPIPVLEARIRAKLEEQAMAEQEAAMKARKEAEEQQMELEREAAENEIKLVDMEMRKQQTESLLQAVNQIAMQLNNLTAQVSQPITVVRDESGAIIGAQ